MKAIANTSIKNAKEHPAIPTWQEDAVHRLLSLCECVLVDGKEDGFKNGNDTLVFALPELNDASNPDNAQIHELVDSYIDFLMESVAALLPHEFQIEPLEGMKGYSRIVRMWWD